MLSYFFGSKSPKPKQSAKVPRASLSSVDSKSAEIKSLAGADRQLHSYDKPSQELGITELLKQHQPGSTFLYAAVTGKSEEDYDSRLRRLRAWKPYLNVKVESFDNLPNLKLYKESEVFPIKPLIETLLKKNKGIGEYFRIVEAMVIYGAIVSPDCNFSKVFVSIQDGRLLTDNIAKCFIADTNKEARGDLKMPYCIPTENADLISLVVSRDNQFLQDGLQWGTIKIKLSLEFSDFPKQYDNEDVMATNMIVGTSLGDRLTNPDVIDISVNNQDRKELTKLFQSGDLADLDSAEKNKKVMRTAKSSVRQLPKGDVKDFGGEWKGMTIPRQDADVASYEPSEDISDTASDVMRREQLLANHKQNQEMFRNTIENAVPIKSIMKRPKFNEDDELNVFD